MSETAQAILAAAMTLSEVEREELVERLLETLPPPEGGEVTEEEFRAELLRRREECLNGTDPGVPWSEVKEKSLRDIDAAANG